MATLSQLRMDHTECVALLILEAKKMGYRCALSEAFRSDEQAHINSIGSAGRLWVADLVESRFPGLAMALRNNGGGGIAMSNHQVGLAVDINLFKDGVYLQTTEDHAKLGAFWKTLHPLARWGGDFRPKPDGNHYSFEYNGVK